MVIALHSCAQYRRVAAGVQQEDSNPKRKVQIMQILLEALESAGLSLLAQSQQAARRRKRKTEAKRSPAMVERKQKVRNDRYGSRVDKAEGQARPHRRHLRDGHACYDHRQAAQARYRTSRQGPAILLVIKLTLCSMH